jgi:hypothetical protein
MCVQNEGDDRISLVNLHIRCDVEKNMRVYGGIVCGVGCATVHY